MHDEPWQWVSTTKYKTQNSSSSLLIKRLCPCQEERRAPTTTTIITTTHQVPQVKLSFVEKRPEVSFVDQEKYLKSLVVFPYCRPSRLKEQEVATPWTV